MLTNVNFKTLREELRLSQQDVAIMLNVTRQTYIKWEQSPDIMPLGKYVQLVRELERLKAIKEEL